MGRAFPASPGYKSGTEETDSITPPSELSTSRTMRTLVVALLVCGLAGVCLAGHFGGIGLGYGGGFGGGFGGGYGGGYGHGLGYVKTVPGPSFLVKTVHQVNRLSHGAHLVGGHYGGGGYGGGFGGGFGGGYGGFGGHYGGYGLKG